MKQRGGIVKVIVCKDPTAIYNILTHLNEVMSFGLLFGVGRKRPS